MNNKLLLTGIVFIAVVALCLNARAGNNWWRFGKHDRVRGSGNLAERTYDLDSFKKIELTGSFNVYVSLGDEQKVTVSCDDNLFEFLLIEVHKDALEIGTEHGVSISPRAKCRVDITVKELEMVDIAGSGDVEIHDLKGPIFEFLVSGSGDFRADGEVDELEIRIAGSGDIDARDLKARDVYVRISGSGDALVYATERVRGYVAGSGDIEYYGDPEHTDLKVSGSGTIRPRR